MRHGLKLIFCFSYFGASILARNDIPFQTTKPISFLFRLLHTVMQLAQINSPALQGTSFVLLLVWTPWTAWRLCSNWSSDCSSLTSCVRKPSGKDEMCWHLKLKHRKNASDFQYVLPKEDNFAQFPFII